MQRKSPQRAAVESFGTLWKQNIVNSTKILLLRSCLTSSLPFQLVAGKKILPTSPVVAVSRAGAVGCPGSGSVPKLVTMSPDRPTPATPFGGFTQADYAGAPLQPETSANFPDKTHSQKLLGIRSCSRTPVPRERALRSGMCPGPGSGLALNKQQQQQGWTSTILSSLWGQPRVQRVGQGALHLPFGN